MENAFRQIVEQYPKGTIMTATVDRGKEFACYERLETAHDVTIYFADHYSSCWRSAHEAFTAEVSHLA